MMKTKMKTINYHQQPTGNTCGPTCIYMILEYLLNKEDLLPFNLKMKYDISDIENFCGTDWIVGTPPDRMEKGMRYLGIDYVEYILQPRPFELLRDIIDNKNISLLRTITKGVPHWIIVDSYDEEYFYVKDPWLGEIKYTEKDLHSIWSVRDYQFFEITGYENS